MTEEEIALLLAELESLLSDLSLDFIVTQERVLAAEGVSKSGQELWERPEVQQGLAPTLDEGFTWGTPRNVRFKSDDVLVTPLDVRSRLAVLLDLVEVATAGTLAMEQFVHDEIATFRDLTAPEQAATGEQQFRRTGDGVESWDGTIVFEDPPEAELRGSSQEAWTLAVDSAFDSATSHAANVVALIESIREQAGVLRGTWLSRGVGDNTADVWAPTKGPQ